MDEELIKLIDELIERRIMWREGEIRDSIDGRYGDHYHHKEAVDNILKQIINFKPNGK